MKPHHFLRNNILVTLAGLAALVLVPVVYFVILNAYGPSTQYFDPRIEGAVLGPDGIYHAKLGDKIFVTYTVIRHHFNGKCLMNVFRYAENVGGPTPGKRHLVDYADLQFRGGDEVLHPRWPLAGLVLGYDMDKHGHPRLNRPLLPPGVSHQTFDLYVVARYRCNFLDDIFPRYLQGGIKPNETQSVRLDIERK